MATNPLDLLRMRKMALAGANRRPAAAAFLDMAGQTGQAPQAPMPSIAEAARLRALKALGASQQPTASITKPRLLTPTSAASGAGSMLPGRGTPGSAALGAFGSTMSQLGGWQDKPMTFGQILGTSLGKAREAYGTAEERQRQIAAEKAAALAAAEEKEYTRSRQSEQDKMAMGRYNIEVKKEARAEADAGKPTKPYQVYDEKTGRLKYVRDVRTVDGGWTQVDVGGVKAEEKKQTKPYDVKTIRNGVVGTERRMFVGIGAEGANAAGEIVVEPFIASTKQKMPYEPANGVVRGKDGSIVGQALLNPDPDATNRYVVRTEDGTERPMLPNEEFMSDEKFKKIVLQEKDMGKLADDISGAERAVRLLQRYSKEQGGTRTGFNRIVDSVMGGFNTFINKDLTQEQLNLVLAQGTLQSLIGNYRIETVGGGVMTEQDALRVISAVGGDVTALQSPQRVKEAVQNLLFEKMQTYNQKAKRYNAQVKLAYDDVYEPKDLLTEEDIKLVNESKPSEPSESVDLSVAPAGFPSDSWNFLSDEDKKAYLAAGK